MRDVPSRLTLLILLTPIACAAPRALSDAERSAAILALRRESIEELEQLLPSAPGWRRAELRHRLAVLRTELADHLRASNQEREARSSEDAAVLDYRALLAEEGPYPARADARLELAWLLCQRGEVDEARSVAAQALRPRAPAAGRAQAQALLAQCSAPPAGR